MSESLFPGNTTKPFHCYSQNVAKVGPSLAWYFFAASQVKERSRSKNKMGNVSKDVVFGTSWSRTGQPFGDDSFSVALNAF